MEIRLPDYVQKALDILNNEGFEAFVVGGCLRDIFLKREINDWDITTNALPSQIMEVFKEYKVIPTGIKHGTITVHLNHHSLEITTYRQEAKYSDHRHPDSVNYVAEINEDLSRRDFTINALAYNPKVGIIDLFDGLSDLSNKVIKCIGQSNERFNEDALRILRALRFSSVLGFKIEENTANAIHQLKDELKIIAIERIREEYFKLLEGKNRENILEEYLDVFEIFIPEIEDYSGINQLEDWISILAYLLQDKDYRKVLNRLKLSNQQIQEIEHIIKTIKQKPETKYEIKELLFALNGDKDSCLKGFKINNKEAIPLLEEILGNNEAYCLKMLDIKGTDLLKLGFNKKEIGIELERLLKACMKGELNNSREELLKYCNEHLN